MVTVSIGLPVYNGADYVGTAIDSILRQTFDDFELIISDNASTDATAEVCARATRGDPRVRYHRQSANRGAATNYNLTFHSAHGKYFKWASHDDVVAPTFLEACVGLLDQVPAAVLAYPRTIIIDSDGRQCGPYENESHLPQPVPFERYQRFLFRKPMEANAVFGLIRSSALARTALIKPFRAADINLLAHLSLLGQFHEIPEPLFFRRDHNATSMRSCQTADDFAYWYAARRSPGSSLHLLRRHLDFLRIGLTAPIPLAQRLRATKLNLKRLKWAGPALYAEFVAALGPQRGSPSRPST